MSTGRLILWWVLLVLAVVFWAGTLSALLHGNIFIGILLAVLALFLTERATELIDPERNKKNA